MRPSSRSPKGNQPVALCVERLEVAPEVLGRPRPARLGIIDLVVLEDHHAAKLVGRELIGRGERDQQERQTDGQPRHRQPLQRAWYGASSLTFGKAQERL